MLTADDIRRSGHRNLAEALRLVPGIFVARVNSSSWVVGARGLTGSSLTATRYLVREGSGAMIPRSIQAQLSWRMR